MYLFYTNSRKLKFARGDFDRRIENATSFYCLLYIVVIVSSIFLLPASPVDTFQHDHASERNITTDVGGLRRHREHSNDGGLCHSYQTGDFRLECRW